MFDKLLACLVINFAFFLYLLISQIVLWSKMAKN